jgi:hypothetical protein
MEADKDYTNIRSESISPQVEQQLASIAQLQLDMTDTIDLIEHDLKGEQYNFKTKLWEKTGTRLMNDEGVRFLISLLHTYLNRNFILSNFDADKIETIMTKLYKELGWVIIMKEDEWDVDKAYRYIILDKLSDQVWASLLRAIDGKTLKAFTQVHTSQEMREYQPKKKPWYLFWR